jgi:hypothetical protein
MGEEINACRLLVGKPEGKRPLERARRMFVDNIKIDLGEIKWRILNWIVWVRIRTSGELLWMWS